MSKKKHKYFFIFSFFISIYLAENISSNNIQYDTASEFSKNILKTLSRGVFPFGGQSKDSLDKSHGVNAFGRLTGLVIPPFVIFEGLNKLLDIKNMKYDLHDKKYYFKYASRKFFIISLFLSSFFKMPFIKTIAQEKSSSLLHTLNKKLFRLFNSSYANTVQVGLLGISTSLLYFTNIKEIEAFDIDKEKNIFHTLKNVVKKLEPKYKQLTPHQQRSIDFDLQKITKTIEKTEKEITEASRLKTDLSFLMKYKLHKNLYFLKRNILGFVSFLKEKNKAPVGVTAVNTKESFDTILKSL